jgi:hypothetical protein
MRHGYNTHTLRRSALQLGGISQKIDRLKTIYLFAVKSFSSVVDFISSSFFTRYKKRWMTSFTPDGGLYSSLMGRNVVSSRAFSLSLYYHFGVLFCFNLIFCLCDAIPTLLVVQRQVEL